MLLSPPHPLGITTSEAARWWWEIYQGDPLLTRNVQLLNSDQEPQQCRAGLTGTPRKRSCWVSFQGKQSIFPNCAHNSQWYHCYVLKRTRVDVLSHVICLLESSLGQGNYNWCPETHSSLCLKMSLTYKQVLVGDLPCEYLFRVDSLNKNHRSPKTFQEDNPGSATEHPG